MRKLTDLPQSPEAERAILGAILLDNMAFYQTDRLKVDDFFLDSHRRIFRCMMTLIEDQKPIDFVTLSELLNRNQELEAIGGNSYMMSLTDGLPRVKNISHHVSIVIDKSRRRNLIFRCNEALEEAYQDSSPIGELIAKTDKQILDIELTRSVGPEKIGNILSAVNSQAQAQWATSQEKLAIGYRTGLDELDEFTTGFRRREVAIIAGWTSDGKTSLARQAVMAQAVDNKKVLVFSREVSKEQLVDDIKSTLAEIHPSHSRDKRKMNLLEKSRYQEIDKIIREWPVWIDDDRGLHIDELVHRARRLIRLEDVEFVVVDYLQLIKGTGNNQTEQMEDVCDGIWNLADSENVAVVALSQLSRDKERKKRRPRLQDLKQASRIEQDAHLVLMPYRPENDNGKETHNDEIIVAKQRHGPVGSIWVEFDRDKLSFKHREDKYE